MGNFIDIYKKLTIVNSVLLFVIIIISILAGVSNRQWIKKNIKGFVDSEKANSKFAAYLDFNRTNLNKKTPKYELKISPKYLRDIESKVQNLKILENKDKIWYPADFFFNSRKYDVKVRIRGDTSPHWKGQKKSWRIKFKKENLFHGYRVIDVILPSDKAYEVESVVYTIGRKMGLLVPDAHFCLLELNGIDMGLYFVIEKSSKEMLEKLQYPEGEIFREDNVWSQTSISGYGISARYLTSNYAPTINKKDPSPYLGYYAARWNYFSTLIREKDGKTFENEIPLYLDMDKFLKWNAITWIFGSQHAHCGDNLRWYYNNTTGLFEPIIYDVGRFPIPKVKDVGTFEMSETDHICKKILRIPKYRQMRNKILWELITGKNINVIENLRNEFHSIKPFLSKGISGEKQDHVQAVHNATIDFVQNNMELIKGHLSFSRIFITPELTFNNRTPIIKFELVCHTLADLKINSIDINFTHPLPGPINPTFYIQNLEGTSALMSTSETTQTDSSVRYAFDNFSMWAPLSEQLTQIEKSWVLKIEFPFSMYTYLKNEGAFKNISVSAVNSISKNHIDQEHIFQFPLCYNFQEPAHISQLKPVKEFIQASKLPFSVDHQQISLPPGEYEVLEDLIIPLKYSLILNEGTTLKMGADASILTYQNLIVNGKASNPVKIIPFSKKPWGAIGVINAEDTSRISYLEVSGGSEEVINGVVLSGQLCFYTSNVIIMNSSISHAAADDGLNIKNANFNISQTEFTNNSSDAFDGDWTTGDMSNSKFISNQGDGIDISGSIISAIDIYIDDTGDKSLSIGEKSTFTGVNIIIKNSTTGLACKDKSVAELYSSALYNNKTAVSSFRKKQIFGGGDCRLTSVIIWNNQINFELDNISNINLNHIGIDDFKSASGISATDVSIGNISLYYDVSGGRLLFKKGLSNSPFAKGPKTEPKQISVNYILPDLSQNPIGPILK